jgi:tol-pal system protein YbgF
VNISRNPTSSLRRVAATLSIAAAAGFGATSVQAGMFDDEEARKAILDLRVDLRARISASEESANVKIAELGTANAALQEQIKTLQRSLLDLNASLEALRAELPKLRGSEEQIARDVAEVQRRQKDIVQAIDERLVKLEPQKASLDGKDFMVLPAEKLQYEQAMATLRGGDFDKSVAALAGFDRRYPDSAYGESVRFWLGNAQYGKRDYKEAIVTFRAFVTASPDHPRAADALLAVANCQVEMKDAKGARKTIDELIKTYPKSDAAAAGKERLATIK